ncbi:MAG: hypothetical protein GEU86_19820 [Actinophytocola sp.]|nr:hypothetical protein [Actinophytocola sp.]
MHQTESRVNGLLPALAPRLLWQVEEEGWLLLGFECVSGRHADLSPGSPDFPAITASVSSLARELANTPADVPALATKVRRMAAWDRLRADPPRELDGWARKNLDLGVAIERSAVELIGGDHLLHTDLHSLNILVGERAWIVDWAWAQTGAAWIDAAFLLIRVIEAGHSPTAAERWAATTDAWAVADADAVTAFAVVVAGMWEYLRLVHPLPSRPAAAAAARDWARHRLGG